jgi:hypothetical protein
MLMIVYQSLKINLGFIQQKMILKHIKKIFVCRINFFLNFISILSLEIPHEIRFPTECVYLALHTSHLGLVSTAKKPQRRNNIIRELNR